MLRDCGISWIFFQLCLYAQADMCLHWTHISENTISLIVVHMSVTSNGDHFSTSMDSFVS